MSVQEHLVILNAVKEGLASQVTFKQRTNGRQMSPEGQTLPGRVTVSAKAPLGKRGSYIQE